MKRFLYILGVILLSLVVVMGVGVSALLSDKVQNAAIQLCADELSRGLGANVQVGDMSYRFPAQLCLHDVYLSDQAKDTLAYIHEIKAHFHPASLLDDHIRFTSLNIRRGLVNIYPLDQGGYNFTFLQRAFASDHSEPMRSVVSVEGITLDSVRLLLDGRPVMLTHSDMDLHYLDADSLDAEVSSLQAYTYQGVDTLSLCNAQSRLQLGKQGIHMPTLVAQMPHSMLDASGVEVSKEGQVDIAIHEAQLTLSDLSLIVPAFHYMNQPIDIKGAVSLTEDSVSVRDFTLACDGRQVLLADGFARNLLSDEPYFNLNCRDIHINAPLVQDWISSYQNRPFLLPAEVHRLGNIHYRGKLDGTLHAMQLRGGLATQLGDVQLSGQFAADSAFQHITYTANVDARQFELGTLLAQQDLGSVSVHLEGTGAVNQGQPSGHLAATIEDVVFRGYSYQQMDILGDFTPTQFLGNIAIADPNIDFHFTGMLDWTNQQPQTDCHMRIRHFRPGVLRLIKGHEDLNISAMLSAEIQGKHLDDMLGLLQIDSLRLAGNKEKMFVPQLTVHAEAHPKTLEKLVSIRSNMLKAELTGQFRYNELPDVILSQLAQKMPSILDETTHQRLAQHKTGNAVAQLDVHAKRLRPLLKILGSSILIWGDVQLRGNLDEAKQQMAISGFVPNIRLNSKMVVHDLNLGFNNSTQHTDAQLTLGVKGIHYAMNNHIASDSIASEIRMIKADSLGGGEAGWIGAITHLGRYANKPKVNIAIRPSFFLLQDTIFHVDPAHIAYQAADTTIAIENLKIHHDNQWIALNGKVSPRMSDSLLVKLNEVDGGHLLQLIVPKRVVQLQGYLSGWVKIFALLDRPVFESDIHIAHFGLCNEYIGDAHGKIALDPTRTHLAIDATAYDSVRERARVIGDFNLRNTEWKLDISPTHFPIAFLNFWVNGIVDDIQGYASGQVRVSGVRKETYVLAQVQAEGASLVVPFTGCRYFLNDSVFLDSTTIRFPHLKLTDEEGNLVDLDGIVKHKCFTNFRYRVNAFAHDARVLDLPEKAGEMLQGKVYANGAVSITGDEHLVQVDATASTAKHSRFRMSLSGASSANENNFVTFVEPRTVQNQTKHHHDDLETDEDSSATASPTIKLGTRVKLGLNIDATQQLLFQLMLDERTGDKIEARGDGGLRLTYDSQTEDVQLLGTYIVQSGSLSFTIGNVIRRDFTVQDGGSIVWNGDPTEPQVNVTANYRVTANLKDLFGSEINQLATTRTNVPVLTKLYMTGPLFSPILRFAIDLPMSEDAIRQQVQSVINTDEMLMRQVVYLLVFSKFFTPEYMATNTTASGLNDTYSLISSTVTGQINSWLSKLTDAFTVGINIRSDGVGDEASQEYEAQFQIQPIDRVLINGNVGYRYNDISNRPFFGDLDVEVLLTDNGRLRLRGYTHTVDKYSLRQASTIQGVGFVWKHDFDWRKKPQPNLLPADSILK